MARKANSVTLFEVVQVPGQMTTLGGILGGIHIEYPVDPPWMTPLWDLLRSQIRGIPRVNTLTGPGLRGGL